MFNPEFEHQSDPLDLSVAQQETILKFQLAARKPEGPAYTGYCLDPNCGEELEAPRRWCNASCREAWEHDRRLRSKGK